MRIGVSLPSIIPGTSGRTVLEWARRAEALGFDDLSTIGRLTFPALEELVTLAAVAGVTERVELMTNVLIGPSRDPVELAKQAASLDTLSDGRFTLGLAAGWREDDFTVTGRPWKTRGRRLDDDLEVMAQVWGGEQVRGSWKAISPRPTNGTGVPLIFGGTADVCFVRAAKWGIGWTSGGEEPEGAAANFERVRAAWAAAGRTDAPRLVASHYAGVGPDIRATASAYLSDYYGDWGPSMAAGMPITVDEIRTLVKGFEAVGADDLILNPTTASIDQLEGFAEAALG